MSALAAAHRDHRALWGLVLGLGLGLFDYGCFALFGIEMSLAGRDVTVLLCLLFALTYAAFGFAIGRLLSTRQALASSLRQLEASQRHALENEKLAAIGRLAAGVAHEVRNPLAVIRSSVSMLCEGLPAEDERAGLGSFILAEVDRLNRFVASLLGFSRPLQPSLQPTPLLPLAEDALRLSRGQLDAQQIASELRCEQPELLAAADPDLLAQVVLGLITNACQAMRHDSESGALQLRLRRQRSAALIEVADSGPGVSSEDAASIFQPFFTTKPDGTGLGLAMARRIVEAHGGQLRCLQGQGAGPARRGACFQIALPQEAAA